MFVIYLNTGWKGRKAWKRLNVRTQIQLKWIVDPKVQCKTYETWKIVSKVSRVSKGGLSNYMGDIAEDRY